MMTMTVSGMRKTATIATCAVMASTALFVATPAEARSACEQNTWNYCEQVWGYSFNSHQECYDYEVILCPPPIDEELG